MDFDLNVYVQMLYVDRYQIQQAFVRRFFRLTCAAAGSQLVIQRQSSFNPRSGGH